MSFWVRAALQFFLPTFPLSLCLVHLRHSRSLTWTAAPVWGCEPADIAWADETAALLTGDNDIVRTLAKQKNASVASSYVRDFYAKDCYLLRHNIILVRSYKALSVPQIFHCVRGNLPTCFPTIEEFESIVPKHLVQRSEENFKNLLATNLTGAAGIVVQQEPRPEPGRASGTGEPRVRACGLRVVTDNVLLQWAPI